jgi:hypothetical protein
MAEETAPELVDPNTTVTTVDMEVENAVESKEKRLREEEVESKDDDVVSKKPKVDEEKSVEEQRLEKLEKNENEEEKGAAGAVNLGPKSFDSSLEMFHYFHKFLHAWPQNLNVNKVFLQFFLFD